MKIPKPPDETQRLYTYIFFQFSKMAQFIRITSEGIKLSKNQHELEVEKQIKKHPQDEHDIRYYEKKHLNKFDDDYIAILNNSTLISCYGLFEVLLKRVAVLAMNRVKSRFTVKDLGSKPDAHDYKKYLEKIIGLDLHHLNEYWSFINDTREIRNRIVHHHANIKTNAEQKGIEKQPHFKVINKYKATIKLNRQTGFFKLLDQEFVNAFCVNAQKYLSGVLRELSKVKKRRKTPPLPKRKTKSTLYRQLWPESYGKY